MLKKYAVDQLKEGMVVGQAVYKEDMSILLGEGTVLNQQMIDSLSERNIVSVEIREEGGEEVSASMPRRAQGTAAKTIPLKEPILDEGYPAALLGCEGCRAHPQHDTQRRVHDPSQPSCRHPGRAYGQVAQNAAERSAAPHYGGISHPYRQLAHRAGDARQGRRLDAR